MRISVYQETLALALAHVLRAVDAKPHLPILANVLIETVDADNIRITGTNLAVSASALVAAHVEAHGRTTMPAHTLAALVSALSPERIDMTLNSANETLHIICGTSKSNLKGISADEYPNVPLTASDETLLLSMTADQFKWAVSAVAPAAAKGGARPTLEGILINVVEGSVEMVTADGYRLNVLSTAEIERHGINQCLVPAKALSEFASRMSGDDPVFMYVPKGRDIVLFVWERLSFAVQMIEGRFPDFRAIIPKTYTTRATFARTDLARALRRAQIIAQGGGSSVSLVIEANDGSAGAQAASVEGKSAERGDNQTQLDVVTDSYSAALHANYNSTFLLEALSAVGGENVVIESTGASAPVVIRAEGFNGMIAIVMPLGGK